MNDKHYHSWQDIETMCTEIVLQMYNDNWRPDYIVGITRGGNVPASIISNMTGIRCEALKVKLRDAEPEEECETNCWMAEDAFGYIGEIEQESYGSRWDPGLRKNILIVDDINDSGATFNWIKENWKSVCLPNEDSWNTVWGKNVRFAALADNFSSEFGGVSYYAHEINKAEDDIWQVFPWENVGAYS